jgi:predicted short-subunit dehydrogenase-like oxidoreductase (DUF2520 family)
MEVTKEITIVGSGNAAWHLAFKFRKAGIKINCIVSKTMMHASGLAENVNALSTQKISDIPVNTDLVLLCVNDNAVANLALEIIKRRLPTAHISGSLPLSVLGADTTNTGVFYPFQTFSKNVTPGEINFPVCVEAENDRMRNLLNSLANKVTDHIVYLSSEQRLHLHLSGVMANNFSNYLMTCAFDYLEQHHIDTQLLAPILEETFNKAKFNHPRTVQTGPAVRGNKEIIKKHLDLLQNDKSLHTIYNLLSDSIEAYYSKPNS